MRYDQVVVGLGFYLVTNLFRALRARVLLPGQKTNFLNLLAVMIAQSMFNNILPARTGEISFIYLLNKHEQIPFDMATVALIVARLFDYLAVAFIFIVAVSLSIKTLPPAATTVVCLALTAIILISGMLLAAVWLGKRGVEIAEWLCRRLGLGQNRLARRGLTIIGRVIRAFEAVHTFKTQLLVFGWSLLVWAFTFAWFLAFLRSIGLNPRPNSLVVGSTFAVLSKAIPFISIGGLGAHEAGWTVGFLLVGFDKTTAILSGFAVNILTMLSSIVLGLWALLWFNKKLSPRAPSPNHVAAGYLPKGDGQ